MSVLNFDQAELDPAQSEEAGGDDITIFGVVISSLFSNCKMLWGHAILHTTTTYDGVCSCCSSSPFPI